MRIIRSVSSHEMARRFAIGEVNSSFFHSNDERHRQETLQLLQSGNLMSEIEGIRRHRLTRAALVDSVPSDTEWNLARINLSKEEFAQLQTIRDPGWINHTGGTLRLVDAATSLQADPGRDNRVTDVVSACKQGQLELRGITLLGQSLSGPFSILEGTARLVALYLCCVISTVGPYCGEDMEIMLGLSQTYME